MISDQTGIVVADETREDMERATRPTSDEPAGAVDNPKEGPDMPRGSCLGGTVKYEIDAVPLTMYHCHCGDCRHASGAGFATNIAVPTESLRIVAGRDALGAFESSPGKHRYVCRTCGSPIYSHGEKTKHMVSVRCGTLLDDPGVRPAFHAYVASKAPWTAICDEVPQFAEART